MILSHLLHFLSSAYIPPVPTSRHSSTECLTRFLYIHSPTHFNDILSLSQLSPHSFSALSLSIIATLLSLVLMIAALLSLTLSLITALFFLLLSMINALLTLILSDHSPFLLTLVISVLSIDLNDCRFFLSFSVITALLFLLISIITAQLSLILSEHSPFILLLSRIISFFNFQHFSRTISLSLSFSQESASPFTFSASQGFLPSLFQLLSTITGLSLKDLSFSF